MRSLLKYIVALAIAGVIAAATVEVGARVWLTRFATDTQFKRYASLDEYRARFEKRGEGITPFVPHRYLGYALTPNHRGLVVHHNALGFRGEEYPLKKPKGEFRVLCIGSSTTYSVYPRKEEFHEAGLIAENPNPTVIAALEKAAREQGMKDLDDYTCNFTYPGFLEQYLHQSGYPNVRVINAGVPGYTSFETMINFELRCIDLDPDVVIVYEGYNDIHSRLVWPHKAYLGDNSGANIHSPAWYSPLPWRMRPVALRILLVATGRQRSPVDLANTFGGRPKTAVYYAYQNEVLQGRFPSKFFQNHPLSEILRANPPIYFRRNIENIVATAQSNQITPVLMTFAARPEGGEPDVFDNPEYRAALAEHNKIIQDVAAKMGAKTFDFGAAYPADGSLFSDLIHMTGPGGRIMARRVGDYLISSGLLPPAGGAAPAAPAPNPGTVAAGSESVPKE